MALDTGKQSVIYVMSLTLSVAYEPIMLSVVMLSVVAPNVMRVSFMLNVATNPVMLSVIMLNVVMLSVAAP